MGALLSCLFCVPCRRRRKRRNYEFEEDDGSIGTKHKPISGNEDPFALTQDEEDPLPNLDPPKEDSGVSSIQQTGPITFLMQIKANNDKIYKTELVKGQWQPLLNIFGPVVLIDGPQHDKTEGTHTFLVTGSSLAARAWNDKKQWTVACQAMGKYYDVTFVKIIPAGLAARSKEANALKGRPGVGESVSEALTWHISSSVSLDGEEPIAGQKH